MHHPAKFVSVEGEDLLKEACLRGLAEGGMLDVTGCPWMLHMELTAPGGLLAGWDHTVSPMRGERGCQSCVDFHQGPRESSGEGVS